MKNKISFLLKNIKIDFFLISLIFILGLCYLIGMKITGSLDNINRFDTGIVMDTAQVARNTIRGEFFVTKYILPVSYTYFPFVIGHPDFIRYPFQILLYSLLFLIFSPNAIVINLLNGFLFLLNGGLIYLIALRIQYLEFKETDKRELILHKFIALFSAVTASLFVSYYFKTALSDRYEIISYTLILIILYLVLNKNSKPFSFGILCGLLYLSKPNFSLFVVVFTLYYLITKFPARKWFVSGLICVSGLLVVVSPFIVRSYIYTGEPLFALQHKIEAIKGVVLSHDELYKSFSQPPSVIFTILNNKTAFFLRWQIRVLSALKNLFSRDYIISWVGLPLFFYYFKKSKWLVYSYLLFLTIHILIVAIYLDSNDTVRVYSILLGFLVVLGSLGLFKFGISLISKFPQIKLQNIIIVMALISLISLSIFNNTHGGLKYNIRQESIPDEVVKKIQEIDPPCIYSNKPYHSAWDLNLPTIYKPVDDSQMLTVGPGECKFFLFYILDKNYQGISDFLSHNGALIFRYGVYGFYRLLQ